MLFWCFVLFFNCFLQLPKFRKCSNFAHRSEIRQKFWFGTNKSQICSISPPGGNGKQKKNAHSEPLDELFHRFSLTISFPWNWWEQLQWFMFYWLVPPSAMWRQSRRQEGSQSSHRPSRKGRFSLWRDLRFFIIFFITAGSVINRSLIVNIERETFRRILWPTWWRLRRGFSIPEEANASLFPPSVPRKTAKLQVTLIL